MINFTTKGLNHQQPHNMKSAENTQWICMKSWNKMQKDGQKGLTGFGRQKFQRKTTKNLWWSFSQVGERGKVEKLLKKCLWKRQSDLFKKTCFTSFDRLKNSLDRSKQIETLSKHFEKSSIDRKSVSINQNRQRLSLTYLKNFDWSKNRMDQSKWTEAH